MLVSKSVVDILTNIAYHSTFTSQSAHFRFQRKLTPCLPGSENEIAEKANEVLPSNRWRALAIGVVLMDR